MVDISNKIKTNWHGKWLWANYVTPKRIAFSDRPAEYKPLSRDEMNVFILARKKFQLTKKPSKAIINITADSRYKLFINGKYIGRGINRCEAYYWYYNSYDITSALKTGDNVIAIHGRFYGMELAYYTPPEQSGREKTNSGKGALLFEIGLAYDPEGKTMNEWIGSDEKTKVIRNIAERSDIPIKNDAIGFTEEFDSRKMPKNWNEVEFDDNGWEAPFICDYPIKLLILDENSPLHEEIIFPEKIVQIGEVDDIYFSGDYKDDEIGEMDFCVQNMLEEPSRQLNSIQVKNPEALLGNGGICEIIPKEGGKALIIMLKFPREMVGYPRIIVDGPAGSIIDIISTEKFKDGRLNMDFLSQKRGSRLILRSGKQVFEQWDWEGFQYTQLKIRKLTGPIKITHFSCNFTTMQTTKKGEFTSDNNEINQLWNSCAHTLRCCAIDAYLDCPSREQRAYLGDAYPEALVANAVFGEPRLTKKIIYDTAMGQRKDGITFSFHPGDYTQQCHIIPDYCFYWIQIAYDYWMYYGEDQVLSDLYPHFVRAIEWFWNFIDPESGLIQENLPYWKFIDWSYPHDKPGINAIINTQFMDVLRKVAMIAQKYGDLRNAEKYLTHAKKLVKNIDEIFWNPKNNCYHDYIKNGQLSKEISQHTNAYLIIMDVAPKEKWNIILNRIFDSPENEKYIQEYLKKMQHLPYNKELLNGSKQMPIIAQPFFMHHVNKFFALMGRYDLMMKFFKLGWVPMTTTGSTGTIWETWSQDGSECHAWSATPAFDLSTYWLGVKPLKPGFSEVEISPSFYGFGSVKGIFPTCKGNIHVEWKKMASENQKTVQVSLEVILPNTIKRGIFKPLSLENCALSKIETENRSLEANTFELRAGKNIFHLFF